MQGDLQASETSPAPNYCGPAWAKVAARTLHYCSCPQPQRVDCGLGRSAQSQSGPWTHGPCRKHVNKALHADPQNAQQWAMARLKQQRQRPAHPAGGSGSADSPIMASHRAGCAGWPRSSNPPRAIGPVDLPLHPVDRFGAPTSSDSRRCCVAGRSSGRDGARRGRLCSPRVR